MGCDVKALFVILLLPVIASTTKQSSNENEDNLFRLPKSLIPVNYDIFLNIDPERDLMDYYGFNGSVNITLNLIDENATVEYIYLHADPGYITITVAELNEADNCTFETLDGNHQIVKISCGNITKKTNVLHITYNGKYAEYDDEYGLAKVTYSDKGKKYFLVQSNFEPTFARRSFPCFDEPDFTATFSIQISHPKEYTAITNTISEGDNTTSADDYIISNFQVTPRISTYLVSFFVSKFQEATYTSTEEGYIFKFLTRPSVANLIKTVAGVYHSQVLEALHNFTGESFQDVGDSECYQVAIPDCYFEDMGNFGLFTYRERDLLDEGDNTTAKTAQNILQTMAFKLSHQWFGGEVATKWWSDAWANEAFPVYFQYVVPNQVKTEFELTNQFVVEVVQRVMQYDALPFAEPLSRDESDVDNEWKIENKLNQYSLLKGASLLHMINFMLRGEDQFKANIQYHLQNRKYSDINGQNMLKDLSKSDGIQDLYSASEPWAFLPGYPMLSVKINESTNEKETLGFSQKRFIYPTENTLADENDKKWTIPVSTTSASKKNFDTIVNVFYAPDIELFIENEKGDWVIFNLQGRFLYRVNYEEQLWKRIINALKSETGRTEIHPLNRAQVIDDIFNIARIGEVDYSLAFELTDFLSNETDYYPWYSAFNAFSYLLGKMKDDDVEANLKNYILNLMDNIINTLDIFSTKKDDEVHVDILKKVMILDWACKLGHTGCVKFVTEEFNNYTYNQVSIQDYNLRSIIFCNAIRYSETLDYDWRFIWALYLASSSVHEQNDLLQALGCANDKQKLLNYLLELAVPAYSADIKRQDTLVVYKSVVSTSAGIEAALQFLESSVKYIRFIFNGGTDNVYILSDMILILADKLFTDDHLERFQAILSEEIFNDYEDLRTRATTLAKVNNYWSKQYQDVIKDIFPETSTSTTTETTSSTDSSTNSTGTTESTSSSQVTTTEPSSTTAKGAGTRIYGPKTLWIFCVFFLTAYRTPWYINII